MIGRGVARLKAVLAAGWLGLAAAFVPVAGQAGSSDWSGQVTLYGWGAGLSGDFTPLPGAPRLSFSKSFSDVLEDLDAAFFMTGLARRGDLVLFGDFTYSASSRAGRVPPGIPAAGDVTIKSATLAAGKRFQTSERSTLDLLAGVRGWSVDGAVTVPFIAVNVAREARFADPIVALRFNTRIAPRWSLLAYLDAGGFGLGSDATWQAAVTANYAVSERLYISGGWRHLYLDYARSGAAFEGSMSGPLLGATFRF